MEIKTKEFTVLTPFSIINKDVQIEDKTRDDIIKIAGYANWSGSNEYGKTYIDLAGDVVVPSGVDTSVWELNPQILWQHDRDDTIGEGIMLEKRSDGIYIECYVHKGAMDEKDWYRIKNGLVKMFSVGFRTLEYEWKDVDGEEVFFITKCLLLEVSAVSIPANSKSGFSVVKSLGDGFTSTKKDNSKGEVLNNTQEDALMNIKVKRADLLSAGELETFKQLGGDVEAEVEVSLADFIKGIVADAVAAAFAAKAEEEAKAEEAAKEAALEAERVEAEAKAAQEAADAEAAAAELAEKEAKELKELNEIKELVASLKAVVAEVK